MLPVRRAYTLESDGTLVLTLLSNRQRIWLYRLDILPTLQLLRHLPLKKENSGRYRPISPDDSLGTWQ